MLNDTEKLDTEIQEEVPSVPTEEQEIEEAPIV